MSFLLALKKILRIKYFYALFYIIHILMRFVFTIILFSLLLSCSTPKEIFVDNPQTLRFGSSGGFTQQTTVYKLLSNGQLSKTDNITKESVLLKQLKKSQTKKVFKQVYILGLDTLDVNNPGNMSNFIQLKTKTLDNKIVWATNSKQSPTEITEFYKILISYTNP